MKKLISVLMVLLLCLALWSCGGEKNPGLYEGHEDGFLGGGNSSVDTDYVEFPK